MQWVEREAWEYKVDFQSGDDILTRRKVELIFEGLDTFATVTLNDKLLGQTDNYFRTWVFDVSDLLHRDTAPNTIHILFRSAVTHNQEVAAKLSPIRMPEQWGYCRKPGYHFGWDWAPRLVTAGVFKPVYLRGYE